MCPRASSVSSPAPRTLASTGSATWRMERPVASAWIWDHRSELAPPPTKASDSSRRLQNFSTAPSSQAELRATPSKTARTMSARVDDSEMLWKPPRMVWSSTGERSPFSQGVKRTPCAPAGTDEAMSLRMPKKPSGAPAAPAGGQRVVGEEQVVAHPGQAGAAGLVLVGQQVATRDPRGDGGDVRQRVGLLEGDVAADPAGGPDVEVGVEVGHGARAHGGRVEVARPGDDRRAGQQAELGGGGGGQATEHAAGRDEVGQLRAHQAGQLYEGVVICDRPDVPVVGDPVAGDGVVRGPGQPGQPQVQVVDRLEEEGRRGVDLGTLLAQEVDVAHGVLARQARDPPGAPHPARQLGGGVALHVERAAHRLPHGAGAPRVHPDDGRADGVPPSSTGTVPIHCEVQPTPTTRAGATPLSASARRAEATMASHQAWGDCSAPPSWSRSTPTAWKAWAATRPVADRTATLGPPVPRSTART